MIQQLKSYNDHVLIEAEFPQLSRHQLFEHFIDPRLLVLWWPQVAEVETREGGRYHLSWPSKNRHLRGVYSVFQPGLKLDFTWKWDHLPDLPHRQVRIDFSSRTRGGFLILEQGSYGPSEKEQEDRQNHIGGWLHYLNELKSV